MGLNLAIETGSFKVVSRGRIPGTVIEPSSTDGDHAEGQKEEQRRRSVISI